MSQPVAIGANNFALRYFTLECRNTFGGVDRAIDFKLFVAVAVIELHYVIRILNATVGARLFFGRQYDAA